MSVPQKEAYQLLMIQGEEAFSLIHMECEKSSAHLLLNTIYVQH